MRMVRSVRPFAGSLHGRRRSPAGRRLSGGRSGDERLYAQRAHAVVARERRQGAVERRERRTGAGRAGHPRRL